MAIGVKGWSTDPTGVIEAEVRADPNSGSTVNLMARQSGVVTSYEFNFRSFCSTPSSALRLIAPNYNCQTGALTFRTTGGDGSPVEYMAIGVKGWSTDPTGVIEAEVRADPNSGSTVNLMARQSGVVTSYGFDFRAACDGKPPVGDLTLIEPQYNCTTSELTLGYSGGDGSPVEFFIDDLTDWTTNTIHVIGIDFPDGKDFTIRARQNGLVISKSFHVAGCPYISDGVVTVSGLDEKKFNPQNPTVTLSITNALFSTNVDDFSIDVNHKSVAPANLNITPSTISFGLTLKDGLNSVSFYVKDSNGMLIEGHYQFWAGANTLPVRVVNKSNTLVSNATVKISLSDDNMVIAEGTTVNGVVTFQNMPVRTIIATALTADNLFGSAAGVANGGSITITLLTFNAPSTVDNNDISLGTQGWNTGNSPVTVVVHKEEGNVSVSKNVNQDLRLSTAGEGPQSISRTFLTKPGTKNVTVRYRFITSEVPGGYFGSQFNDYFSVAIRSKTSGTIASEQNSMNGLGLGAFNYSTGETAWREKTLSVGSAGEEIQVDVVVANVADALYDSQVEVDFIDEKRLTISDVAFFDPDKNNTLKYLSIDQHAYFDGKVPIYGAIKIKGPSDDRLTSLRLEVIQGGQTIATADLASAAQSKLFELFGSDEQVEIDGKELLFQLPSRDPLNVDGIVQLRLTAKTEHGQEATKDYGVNLPNMMLFRGLRYGKRDETMGGDGWGLPSVIQYINTLDGKWSINDISNMNGNVFPPHGSHREGVDADVYFNGYNERNATVAKTLVDFLNSPLGSRVEKIFVTYTKAFSTALESLTLARGGKASTVILNAKDHDTHFHIRVIPGSVEQQAPIYVTLPPRSGGRIGTVLASELNVFPNPVQFSRDKLSIRLSASGRETITAEIINMNGQFVNSISTNPTSEEAILSWDGTDFSGKRADTGLYLVKVRTLQGKTETKRFIVLK